MVTRTRLNVNVVHILPILLDAVIRIQEKWNFPNVIGSIG